MTPNLFIIGAQKAGTTYLLRHLRQHPEIYLYPEELHFFREPYYDPTLVDAFESLLVPRRGERVVGMKCPGYLHYPGVTARLAEHYPAARIIVSLRDPIDRFISAYYHYVRHGRIPVADINEGLAAILDGSYDVRYPYAGQILAFGRYAERLEALFRAYDRPNVLCLISEAVAEDPDGSVQGCCEFLGVGPRFSAAVSRLRSNTAVYSLPRLRICQALGFHESYEYWLHAHEPLSRIRWRLAHTYLRALRGIDRLVLARILPNPPENPVLAPALEKCLATYYRPDAERTGELLASDLSQWRVFKVC